MNGKMYWVLRKTIQNIVFRVKKVIYRLIDGTTGISEYKSFRQMIIKYSLLEIAKGIADNPIFQLWMWLVFSLKAKTLHPIGENSSRD